MELGGSNLKPDRQWLHPSSFVVLISSHHSVTIVENKKNDQNIEQIIFKKCITFEKINRSSSNKINLNMNF